MERNKQRYRDGGMGGIFSRITRSRGKDDERGGRDIKKKKELRKEEISRIVRKLKDEKAVGIDGIPGEIWKYESEQLEE